MLVCPMSSPQMITMFGFFASAIATSPFRLLTDLYRRRWRPTIETRLVRKLSSLGASRERLVVLLEGQRQADEIQIERKVRRTQAAHGRTVEPRGIEVQDGGVLLELEVVKPETERDVGRRLPLTLAIVVGERHQHHPQCGKRDASDFHDAHLHADDAEHRRRRNLTWRPEPGEVNPSPE